MALIALVRPPQVVPFDSVNVSQGTPSIAIAYLTGSLKRAGHRVVVVDALGEDLNRIRRLPGTGLLVNGLAADEVVEKIPKDVDVIGVSCMFSCEWIYSKVVIQAIAARFPGAPIVAGGEHITADAEYAMRSAPGIKLCALGEGEETLVDAVSVLMSGGDISKIKGVAYRDADGNFVKTEGRARIRAIDEIPWPSWEESPLENFLDLGFGFNAVRGRPIPMLASRGCPYQCTFCSNPQMWTTRWIARDPGEVIKEIKHYVARYHVDHVEFYDLTTIVKKDWIVAFTQLLLKENISITWGLPSGTRSEALDQEVLRLLKKSGCNRLTYAPESGSPATLKRIKKMVKLPRMLQSIRWAVEAGIGVKCNIIFGFPGETKREVLETFWFLLKCAWAGMHDVAIFTFLPYPGTELFFQLVEEGRIPKDSAIYEAILSGNILGELAGMRSWSEHISNRQLQLTLVLGVLWFYGWQFVFRPHRFLGMVWRLIRSRPEGTMDIILDGILRNFVQGRRRKVKPVEMAVQAVDLFAERSAGRTGALRPGESPHAANRT